MSSEWSLTQLAEVLAGIESDIGTAGTRDDAFGVLTRVAVDHVPGAEFAGVTFGRPGSFTSIAPTSELVARADQIQYDLESGPCVDAILEDARITVDDLRTDPRWPTFGEKAASETGIASMLAVRLFLERDGDTIAALNLYSRSPAAFGAEDQAMAVMLATAGALAVSGAAARERVANLERALETNREIGTAIGVLMSQYKVTRDQGFDLLRMASQSIHRKIADIAHDVVETGALPELPTRRRADNPRA